MRPDAEHRFTVTAPLNLRLTLAPLRHGYRDPTARLARSGELWRASRLPSGPVTFQVTADEQGVIMRAWGPGADELIGRGDGLLGLDDDPTALKPQHTVVRDLMKRSAGMRLTRGTPVHEILLPTIIGQRVTGKEGHMSWTALARRLGEPAPGPVELKLPPAPRAVLSQPDYAFHRFGIEGKRAAALREVSRLTRYLEALHELPPVTAFERLCKIRGVGPWTAAMTVATTHGWADAVPIGDDNLPVTVSYALTGERRADDRRMVELLAPYVGQRWRVLRLLKSSGIKPPRRAPRAALRDEYRDYDAHGNLRRDRRQGRGGAGSKGRS